MNRCRSALSCARDCMHIQLSLDGGSHAPITAPALPTQARPHASLAAPHLALVLTPTPRNLPHRRAAERRALRTDPPMNAPMLPEVLARRGPSPQADLPLSAEGVLRYVWESRFGPMLIEVEGDRVYVNGDRVDVVGREAVPPARDASDAPADAPPPRPVAR